jgi:hypothetical protein
MKKAWRNPVKGQSPSPQTLAIEGDFEKFTADMKNLFQVRPKAEKQKPTSASASRAPVAAS